MNNSKLIHVILEQNKHWPQGYQAERYINRELLKQIKINSNFIEVITGVRRSGKSTIFRILIDKLIKEKKIHNKEILFINFDHPIFIPFYKKVEKLDKIIEEAEVLNKSKIKYLFLDEIQNIYLWEKWIKAKYDEKCFKKIFITGSNSNLLSSQYTKRLSGRYFAHVNFPFSFPEYLTFLGKDFHLDYASNFSIKNELAHHFKKYLKFGGFPEFVREDDLEILKSYYETIILKDCLDYNQIRDSLALKEVSYFLLNNVSSLYSYNKIGKYFNIHENTAKQYLENLKEAYLFLDLKKFDPSLKKQLINQKKIYCIDNGLVSSVGFGFFENHGPFLENFVAIELSRRNKEYFYFKNKKECDFLIKENQAITQAIQVCWEINEGNRARELSGLIEAMDTFNLKQGCIITFNHYETIEKDNRKINLIPGWLWALENVK